MSSSKTRWVQPLYAGALSIPEKVRGALGWSEDDVVLVETADTEDGKELRVRRCKEVDVLDVEMWFEDYFTKVELGEVFVIRHGDDRVLFMPTDCFEHGVELRKEPVSESNSF